MNVYITGDTHGNFLRIDNFCQKINPEPDDVIITLPPLEYCQIPY